MKVQGRIRLWLKAICAGWSFKSRQGKDKPRNVTLRKSVPLWLAEQCGDLWWRNNGSSTAGCEMHVPETQQTSHNTISLKTRLVNATLTLSKSLVPACSFCIHIQTCLQKSSHVALFLLTHIYVMAPWSIWGTCKYTDLTCCFVEINLHQGQLTRSNCHLITIWIGNKELWMLKPHSIRCESRVSWLEVYETCCDKVGADFEHRGIAWVRATSSGLMYCYLATAVMGNTERLIAILVLYILKQVSNVCWAFWNQQVVLNMTLGSAVLEMFTPHAKYM